MDANRIAALLRALSGRSSRRGIAPTLVSIGLGTTLGAGAVAEAGAKRCSPCRKKKHGKCKRKKPDGTPCADGHGVCGGGVCACGGGPACPLRQVCLAGHCFPQGTCPTGTKVCPAEGSTACAEDCFCGLSAEGSTVCFQSAGLCFDFSTCETAAACSACHTSADCDPGAACVDVSGCCEGTLRDAPLPAGTRTCVSPCFAPQP
jgi:hypothetical protein